MNSEFRMGDVTAHHFVERFGAQREHFPEAALREALTRWNDVSRDFVILLRRYLDFEEQTPEVERALFFIIHLFGEKKERKAFDLICQLLLDPESSDKVLGFSMTETLSGIILSTYNGNSSVLKKVIEDPAAPDVARTESLIALAYLTSAGQIEFEATNCYLRKIRLALLRNGPFEVAIAWTLAVAFLGFRDLAVDAESFFEKSENPFRAKGLELFRKDLERAVTDPSRMICFENERIGPIDDVIPRMSQWFI